MCHDPRGDFYKSFVANNERLKLGNEFSFIEPIGGQTYQVTLSHLHPAKLSRTGEKGLELQPALQRAHKIRSVAL